MTLAATALLVTRSGLIDYGKEALPHVNDLPVHPISWNGAWMRRLAEAHLKFATKSVYTCYEMHRWIVDMRKCLVTQIDESGSSHKQSKRHKK